MSSRVGFDIILRRDERINLRVATLTNGWPISGPVARLSARRGRPCASVDWRPQIKP